MPFADAKYPPKRRGRRSKGERAFDELLDCLKKVRNAIPEVSWDRYGHCTDKVIAMVDKGIARAEGGDA